MLFIFLFLAILCFAKATRLSQALSVECNNDIECPAFGAIFHRFNLISHLSSHGFLDQLFIPGFSKEVLIRKQKRFLMSFADPGFIALLVGALSQEKSKEDLVKSIVKTATFNRFADHLQNAIIPAISHLSSLDRQLSLLSLDPAVFENYASEISKLLLSNPKAFSASSLLPSKIKNFKEITQAMSKLKFFRNEIMPHVMNHIKELKLSLQERIKSFSALEKEKETSEQVGKIKSKMGRLNSSIKSSEFSIQHLQSVVKVNESLETIFETLEAHLCICEEIDELQFQVGLSSNQRIIRDPMQILKDFVDLFLDFRSTQKRALVTGTLVMFLYLKFSLLEDYELYYSLLPENSPRRIENAISYLEQINSEFAIPIHQTVVIENVEIQDCNETIISALLFLLKNGSNLKIRSDIERIEMESSLDYLDSQELHTNMLRMISNTNRVEYRRIIGISEGYRGCYALMKTKPFTPLHSKISTKGEEIVALRCQGNEIKIIKMPLSKDGSAIIADTNQFLVTELNASIQNLAIVLSSLIPSAAKEVGAVKSPLEFVMQLFTCSGLQVSIKEKSVILQISEKQTVQLNFIEKHGYLINLIQDQDSATITKMINKLK